MDKNLIIIIIIAILGLGCLIGVFKQMKDGFGPYNLKVYGLTFVVIIFAILILSDIQLEKLTICFSILSTFAGYLFGLKKDDKLMNNTCVRRSKPAANKGLKEMAGEVVNQTVVLTTNFCGRLTVPASNPPLL